MKRFLAILCLITLCLSLMACSSSLSEKETGTAEETATAANTEEEKETGPIVYPEGFSVGYATGDITGSTPIDYYGGTATSVHDPLLLTCVAVCDGENVALIMTADLKKMLDNVANKSLEIIEKNFGIPAENVIISCTHTHSAPDAGSDAAGNIQWLQQYYKKLPAIVESALRDLDPVEGAYTGKANTEKPIAFVRRYLLADGSYKTNPSESDQPVAHESEADPEFRTIRFDRKNKKDVLMVNFQTHYGGAPSMYPSQLSADFVHPFREEAQEEFDCLFAYYSGAGGNINFKSMIPGERVYSTFIDAIDGFMDTTRAALQSEEKAETGKVVAYRSVFQGEIRHDPEERVAKAKEVQAAGYESAQGISLMEQYGFESWFDASFTITRSKLGETKEVPLNAIAFGDFAFTGNPYEMFDTNGKEIRDASPYKTTFICTLSGGANGYVPSALGYANGGYETFNCLYVPGSGEMFAQELVRLLNACKENA